MVEAVQGEGKDPNLIVVGIGDDDELPVAMTWFCAHAAISFANELRQAAQLALADERERGCPHGFGEH
jgi:hypothetical protein